MKTEHLPFTSKAITEALKEARKTLKIYDEAIRLEKAKESLKCHSLIL